MSRKVIDAELARPLLPASEPPAVEEAGEASGMVEVKTRLPIHLHLAMLAASERSLRSLSAEMRFAVQKHVEREAARR